MKQISIGRLSERSGVAPSALRFYEERGLIHSRRTPGNQRVYDQSTLRRIGFIRGAQAIGLTLDEIAAALATLPDNRTPTKADWSRLSRSWRGRLDEQIARVEALRDKLDGCIGCGCLSLKTCALYNPDDVVGEHSHGPVLLKPGSLGPNRNLATNLGND